MNMLRMDELSKWLLNNMNVNHLISSFLCRILRLGISKRVLDDTTVQEPSSHSSYDNLDSEEETGMSGELTITIIVVNPSTKFTSLCLLYIKSTK